MRPFLVIALAAGCTQAPAAPKSASTLVIYDTLLSRDLNRLELAGLKTAHPAWEDWSAIRVDDAVVLQNPTRKTYIRFDCADHRAGHPLEVMYEEVGYRIHCE